MHVIGKTTEPYTIINPTEPAGDVALKLEKFLLGKNGNVLKHFKSGVESESSELKTAIDQALIA